MTETLFIRLGSRPHDIIHWLIWSNVSSDNNEVNKVINSEANIIASGELSGVESLSVLTEKAAQRKVIALVPGCDIALKSLNVPSKSKKAMQLAAPYMLEDELAQDVELLFFAYGKVKVNDKTKKANENCFIAAVDHQQIKAWQAWLSDAQILCKVMIPDVLAMPNINQLTSDEPDDTLSESWSAIRLGEQILVRQDAWQGMVVDQQTWPIICQQFNQAAIDDETENSTSSQSKCQANITIHAYSDLPEELVIGSDIATEAAVEKNIIVKVMPAALPLALLAVQIEQNAHQAFNLLQGQYQLKEQKSPALKSWLKVAVIACFALLLNLGIKSAELMQLSTQQAAIEAKIITTYKKAFPASKRVRVNTVKSQLKRKMAELGSASTDGGFLAMLAKLEPAFKQVSALKPETIKFDSKRQEIRLQAVAKDYQAFDQFKINLEKLNLTVTQGAQNNQGEIVSGSFSITNASNNTSSRKGAGS